MLGPVVCFSDFSTLRLTAISQTIPTPTIHINCARCAYVSPITDIFGVANATATKLDRNDAPGLKERTHTFGPGVANSIQALAGAAACAPVVLVDTLAAHALLAGAATQGVIG